MSPVNVSGGRLPTAFVRAPVARAALVHGRGSSGSGSGSGSGRASPRPGSAAAAAAALAEVAITAERLRLVTNVYGASAVWRIADNPSSAFRTLRG